MGMLMMTRIRVDIADQRRAGTEEVHEIDIRGRRVMRRGVVWRHGRVER